MNTISIRMTSQGMRTIFIVAIALCCCVGDALAKDELNTANGFKALFNGEDFEGWYGGETRAPGFLKGKPEGEWGKYRIKMYEAVAKHWHVENGELIGSGDGPDMVTWGLYSDFELQLEWKVSPSGESGISLRGYPGITLWDTASKALHARGADRGSGGLFAGEGQGTPPTENADKPTGQWNTMVVRMVGPYVTVTLNGQKVQDGIEIHNAYKPGAPLPAAGPIHLQVQSGEVRFRNVSIRALSDEEANKRLDGIVDDDNNFTPLFKGEGLAGWTGALHGYESIEGGIRSKRGGKALIVTEKQYRDFIVRLEFKLPPGGNSGLILRAPGPTKPGLELQVLDNPHEMFKSLKNTQYHGSAYGISAARRGFLRPTGQWNHQEVYLEGDHLRVTLNGYEILNTKLKEAAPKNANATRAQGHFGFLGHNDPVSFRHVRIKEIE